MPTRTPTRRRQTPDIEPKIKPKRRADPDITHCPDQTVRTIRRVRDI